MYNGEAYGRTKNWLRFFDKIATNIIDSINPETVADVGCAYGLLVECLNDKGVNASGFDISEYAIDQGRSDIKQKLAVHSILKPLPHYYDLIVSIEVIEHIYEQDCELAIRNMCCAADKILLSTIPDDFDDPTHFNVQPPLYWIKKFAEQGFEPDISFDATFLTPYAILFRKIKEIDRSHLNSLFGEKKLKDLEYSRVNHQRNIQTSEIAVLKRKISEDEDLIGDLNKRIIESQTHIFNLQNIVGVERNARKFYQGVVDRYHSSVWWKCVAPLRILLRVVKLFLPIFPRVVVSTDGGERTYCDSKFLGGWGLLTMHSADSERFIFYISADMGGDLIRVPTLPIISDGSKRSWLFRKKTDAVGYVIEVPNVQLKNLSVSKISSIYAWLKLLSLRWRLGKGGVAALRFGLRVLRSCVKLERTKLLEEVWPTPNDPDQNYEEWIHRFDSSETHKNVSKWIDDIAIKPLISIIIPTYNSDMKFLSAAIESIKGQSYKNWQLCISDDASSDLTLRKWLIELSQNPAIDVVLRPSNGHISAATNSAIDLAKGDFVVFLDHDDELHPHALAAIASKITTNPNLDFIYSDEDKIDAWGNRCSPNFKPDWNPDLLLSQNYICHLAVCRLSLLKEIGGFREGYEGAQDYDLFLRITEKTKAIAHIPHILYHWRMINGSTALDSSQKDYAHKKAILALEDAISRRELNAAVEKSGLEVYHRIKYNIAGSEPLVSIIIPTRDHVELVKACIEGIKVKTHYLNWEILIIDNDSIKLETKSYFSKIAEDNIRVLNFPGKFNYSAINNFGAKNAKGEILLLLNNDIEVIEEDWLRELVSHCVRPEIGAVGSRLYYSDDHVQHDGIVIGIGGVAGYANPRMDRVGVGEFGGSRLLRNYSAVTAAALAVRKEVFEEVGGLDEENLAVAFNDVDFCLRLQQAGYRNLYTPYAELYHHESISRGPDIGKEKAQRFEREALYMKKKWISVIEEDPHYNSNLSLKHGYSIDLNRGRKWPWQDYI
ncbi:glycosyltransferase [Rhodospirillaceae bacterium]|nr:glycosyltransferase [Rhodospirillaceae bacterium]